MAGAAALSYRVYDLPWTTNAEQESRFRRQLMLFVVAALLVALVLSILPVPERDPMEVVEIPERYARLLLEQEAPPAPPPAPVVEQEPESPAEPEALAEEVVEPEPAEPVPVPEPEPEPVDAVAEARERASVAGLLPFTQQLASLRDVELSTTLQTNDLAVAVAEAQPVAERSLIASNVGTSSGGIDTAALSRSTGGSGIGSRSTTVVDSPVEGLGSVDGSVTRTGQSDLGSRSREEIERVFDRNKGAIYALYNRALRADPTLQGKVVLRLTIMADGSVSFCEIVSSELGDPELEQRLVQRILLFQFEPRDVEAVTTTKPIDFFPA